MPTPDGPQSATPAAFLPAGCASGTMNVRHTTAPVFDVERVQAAAERAALVARLARGGFFHRRDRDEEAILVERRRSGDARVRMFVEPARPELASRCRVERVDVRAGVAEVDGVAARPFARPERERRPHAALRRERPVDAAALRVERVDRAVLAADEDAAAGDGRLRPGRRRVGKSERPLQRQLRHLLGVSARPAAPIGIACW